MVDGVVWLGLLEIDCDWIGLRWFVGIERGLTLELRKVDGLAKGAGVEIGLVDWIGLRWFVGIERDLTLALRKVDGLDTGARLEIGLVDWIGLRWFVGL